jgi:hypothetical protein
MIGKPKILVRRIRPGLGDVICSSVPMRAVLEKYGDEFEVCATFGLRRWVELFQDQGVADVVVSHELARASSESLASQFDHIFELDGVEFRTSNHLGWSPLNRIEIWCDSVDHRPADMCPRWKPRLDKSQWAQLYIATKFHKSRGNLPLVILQALPDLGMPWKRWPYMPQLAERLARDYRVLVLHDKPLPEYAEPNGFAFECGLDLRQLGSVLSLADLVVAPDSSFIHFAAAVDVPCLGLFGGTSGEVTCKFYRRCKFIQAGIEAGWKCFGSAPCAGMAIRGYWCHGRAPNEMAACMEQHMALDLVYEAAINMLKQQSG